MVTSKAYRSGVTSFKCGCCPECMQERSSSWALRAVYEAKKWQHSCMITLTYDSFKYDNNGKEIGENPVDPTIVVDKTHIQKFMKRLRKKFGAGIKYIACAEYGSRTHRAHYHCILFNVRFPDLVYYKRSKRGNPIYRSQTLTDLWTHGICTVDSINVHSAAARYCTKYCAKTRSSETFMLFSQNIGTSKLLEDFNGRFYMIEGRKHTVPRVVWQQYISRKYAGSPIHFDYRYKNRDDCKTWKEFLYFRELRQRYYDVRDNDPVYKQYIAYWKDLAAMYEKGRASVIQRIYALDDGKYMRYKTACLNAYSLRVRGTPVPSPGSNQKSAIEHWLYNTYRNLGIRYIPSELGHLLYPSRPNTASDTKRIDFDDFDQLKQYISMLKAREKRVYDEKYKQLCFL